MAIFSVSKSDLVNSPHIEAELRPICNTIIDGEKFVLFIPKAGHLVAVGVYFTEKGISYQLDFHDTKSAWE